MHIYVVSIFTGCACRCECTYTNEKRDENIQNVLKLAEKEIP